MRTREEIEAEVRNEIVAYIEGDAEDGPRHGVFATDEEIAEEVTRRAREEIRADVLRTFEAYLDIDGAPAVIAEEVVEEEVARREDDFFRCSCPGPPGFFTARCERRSDRSDGLCGLCRCEHGSCGDHATAIELAECASFRLAAALPRDSRYRRSAR